MHMAAEAGYVEVVKLLVESGASPRVESQVSENLFSNDHDRSRFRVGRLGSLLIR